MDTLMSHQKIKTRKTKGQYAVYKYQELRICELFYFITIYIISVDEIC